MWWFASRPRMLLAAASMLWLLNGCFQARPCASVEQCNGLDDDCDGVTDEGFLDDAGRYATVEHCGRCGVACASVFPSALETACDVVDLRATCRIEACPLGQRPAGDGACVPEAMALCLPCESDADCLLREDGAFCAVLGDEGRRCVLTCDGPCPAGTTCQTLGDRSGCLPDGGCACNASNEGLARGCVLMGASLERCAGLERCEASDAGFSFGSCEAALQEACNDQDDDCDGRVDEDFKEGDVLLGPLHCGACQRPCVPQGPNMEATCVAESGPPRCDMTCLEGFVDVDGIASNGCECERFDGEGPPPSLGTDRDCDGVVDDDDAFVYVTTTGNDGDPGTLLRPLRTLSVAVQRGLQEGKDVLVAQGVYAGFTMADGVSVFGGYRSDFRDRDLEQFPVTLEGRSVLPGFPVVECHDVASTTQLDGVQVRASDAALSGQGSTALRLDGCGATVRLRDVTVFAGRGEDGERGASSTDRLMDRGVPSLAALDGVAGSPGLGSTNDCVTRSGTGGVHACVTAAGDRVRVDGGDGAPGACPDLGCAQGVPCGNAGCTDFTVDGVCDVAAALSVAVANPSAEVGRGSDPGLPGEPTYNAPTNRSTCNFCDDNPTVPRLGGIGQAGGHGFAGNSGEGCAVAPRLRGAFLEGEAGGAGSGGTDGSGGGGGSGGSGYAVIGGTVGGCSDVAGGSGGGGGSGGCGAPGGGGGRGGGSSVGVLLRLAAGAEEGPVMENVRIVTASGGAGGDGGSGAAGGAGGLGAAGGATQFYCARAGGAGGAGGTGGAGGAGGGGCGGGSHAVVVVGAASDDYLRSFETGVVVEQAGVPGRGGRGGVSPAGAGGAGNAGSAASLFALP